MFRKRQKPTEVVRMDELEQLAAEGKPILIDFWKFGCNPCRMMDGIVGELADEFAGSAHVVKVNVGKVPGAIEAFGIRSTPTFVLLGRSQKKPSKKARKRAGGAPAPSTAHSPRWRASGLINKDVLTKALESNGAKRG
jgi:thioredoxin 1